LDAKTFIKTEADRCVMCGLCLPHCPTYAKTRNEAESPRGRISLMKALATGDLPLTPTLQQHLDNCLLCRACENKCPSGVNYGALMDATRNSLAPPASVKTTFVSLDQLATDRTQRQRLGRGLALLENTGLRALGRGLGITKLLGMDRLEQLAPKMRAPHPWQNYYPAINEKRGDVALFTGCFTELFDQQTLDAAIKVLTHLGYGVFVPATQTCCGALHWHKGDGDRARQLAEQNRAAFAELNISAIISTATGCGAHLGEYDRILNGDKSLALQVRDINRFLNEIEWPATIKLQPLAQRAAVHDPCSLVNVLKGAQHPYQLLAKIQQLDITPLPGNNRCCGAAGSYMLDHPAMADSLRDDKIAALCELKPDLLVTSNIGCAMHLAAGARQSGLTLEVVHPVMLLARQICSQ
jgi:glycolate oxidase iron-sulfur subunit